MDNKVLLNVTGMDCANCAQTITRTLEKTGLQDVKVNFATGEVQFEIVAPERIDKAVTDINSLGYKVVHRSDDTTSPKQFVHDHLESGSSLIQKKFFFSLIFTIPLLLHMVFPGSFLHNPYLQLGLALPVMGIGTWHFGRSAWKSIKAGVPNMDVLISLGSSAAFVYSLIGTLLYAGTSQIHNYLFYETGATIITLVFLGNLIEHRSVRQTTSAIRDLSKLQAEIARKIVLTDGKETIVETPTAEIKAGDLLQVNTGDKIPVDGKITWGGGLVNESLITGESLPVVKETGAPVTGSTLLENGNFRMIAEHVGEDTTLSRIIDLVKNAQHSKPPIQKLGDRISAVFVPAVVGISLLTFMLAYFFFHLPVSRALMNSIAVLVISCPCAMGLATPTAVMVGLGRAARNGILIKGGQTLETLQSIRTVVFDKTGTLTTGNFRIKEFKVIDGEADAIKAVLYSLEKHSSHPIARSLVADLKDFQKAGEAIAWKSVEEDKGIGINATDQNGNLFSVGSFLMVKHFYSDLSHSIYILKNNKLIATVDLEDEIKKGAAETVQFLKKSGIEVVMISGDRRAVCQAVAEKTGITKWYGEQHPKEKLELISAFSRKSPTAMVGDGINDAPALAAASVGISLSNATQVAIQSSQVVLLKQEDLSILLKALSIGKMTYQTIRQNLFWAFFYNVIAIPIAATGYLSPMIGALSMAFSDLIVIGNSLRLRTRKIQ